MFDSLLSIVPDLDASWSALRVPGIVRQSAVPVCEEMFALLSVEWGKARRTELMLCGATVVHQRIHVQRQLHEDTRQWLKYFSLALALACETRFSCPRRISRSFLDFFAVPLILEPESTDLALSILLEETKKYVFKV